MFRTFALLLVAALLSATLFSAVARAEEPVDYLKEIKPLLMRKCKSCHGALRQRGNLRLDVASLLIQGGDSGAAIVPGNSGESLLIDAVTTGEQVSKMPAEGEPLSEMEVALLRRWIDQGTTAPDEPIPADPRKHWSYQPPQRPALPAVKDAAWVLNPIDSFIAARREAEGLEPLPPTDKATLLRRVYLDLIGLPPTREQLHAFLSDDSPQAYQRVVDQLLESPRYGERWGRHWMDVWRYADWYGYRKEIRNSQRHIWHWRDWIIESLSEDKPYDQMLREMIAGDELAPDDPEVLRATGFLARNWFKFNRNVWLDSTIEHTSKAMLGVTLNCARCHDHMYDPISQVDYYRFRAIFEPHEVRTDRLPGESDLMQAGLPRVYDAKAATPTYLFERGNDRSPRKDDPLKAAVPAILGGEEIQPQEVQLPREAHYPGLREFVRSEETARATQALTAAEAAFQKAAAALRSAELSDEQRLERARKVNVAAKALAHAQAEVPYLKTRLAADAAKHGEESKDEVHRLSLAAGAAQQQFVIRREELRFAKAELQLVTAEAMDDKNGKKKAAVEAAQRELSTALKVLEKALADAKTPTTSYSPLGPQYPQTSTGRRLALVQWMTDRQNPLTARVAVNHIWLRHFGAALVPTVFDFGLNGKPPTHPQLLDWLALELMDNNWSTRHLHRLMVTSNMYRMGSDSAELPQANLAADPDNLLLWRMNARRMEAEVVRDAVLHVAGALDLTMGGPEIDHEQGQTSQRRSIYFRHAHEKQMTFLKLFDAASVNECYRRDESVVPQQALALANSPLALAQSRVLAKKLAEKIGFSQNEKFINAAYEQVLGRAAGAEETSACLKFLSEQAERLGEAKQLTRFTAGPKSQVPPSQDPRQRARENLVHVLLNHNDFLTIR